MNKGCTRYSQELKTHYADGRVHLHSEALSASRAKILEQADRDKERMLLEGGSRNKGETVHSEEQSCG
jgi:hypothetical protein